MRALLLGVIALALASCSTPYQESGFGGGYEDMPLGGDMYRINVRGNGFSDTELTNKIALVRAAELTLEHGFTHFVVGDASSGETTSFGGFIPGHSSGYVSGTAMTNGPFTTFNGYGTGSYTPATPIMISKPRSEMVIKMLRSQDAVRYGGLDARQILAEYGPDVGYEPPEAPVPATAAAPAAAVRSATVPPSGGGAATSICSSFLQAGSRLSQDVAAIGPGGGCMPMSLGADTTGNTLIAEGAGTGGARMMVVISRSDQPLGEWAAIEGREDELISHMTDPGHSASMQRLPIQSSTTLSGHRIEMVGFTGNRPGDPVQYACVAASDRTSEKTIAIVCRSTTSGEPGAVARNIVSQDLPAVRW